MLSLNTNLNGQGNIWNYDNMPHQVNGQLYSITMGYYKMLKLTDIFLAGMWCMMSWNFATADLIKQMKITMDTWHLSKHNKSNLRSIVIQYCLFSFNFICMLAPRFPCILLFTFYGLFLFSLTYNVNTNEFWCL